MKNKTRSGVLDTIAVAGLIIFIAIVLAPAFRTCSAGAHLASHCQSNLNQIGKAFKLYLRDNNDVFPPNRLHGKQSSISESVPLSDLHKKNENGKASRFQYGVNWIECLHPYIEKVSEGDPASVWRCPAASKKKYFFSRPKGQTTYAFNANLVEAPESVIKNTGILMLARELDRPVDAAVLRPANKTPDAKNSPKDAFLCEKDDGRHKLHGDGSNLLFADGRVKNFPTHYFNQTCQWDPQSKQWYNWVDDKSVPEFMKLSIAVSP